MVQWQPSASTSTDATPREERLQFETTTDDGSTTRTVLRDADGRVAYPAFVPPDVESLTNTAHHDNGDINLQPGTRSQAQSQPSSTPPPEPIRKPSSDPVPRSHVRPPFDARVMTDGRLAADRPPPVRKSLPRRAGTSYLSKVMREGASHATDDPSDDSSDDSDSDGENSRAYKGNLYQRFNVRNENYKTKGRVKRDGRLRITLEETANTGYLAKALGSAMRKAIPKDGCKFGHESGSHGTPRASSGATVPDADATQHPRLNIVIMVIGSRGDAQPFLKIGKVLKEQYGHRVRIATHPAFRGFVEKDSGLEFFSVGGDPSELMAFMVKNPGMIPTLETVRAGDIGRRRAAMAEMFEGFWRACISSTDDEKDTRNLKMMGAKDPFVADAIIANPPSFAHVHCAEALGIPLHLMFTFPYTPTQAFPHPLASIKRSNVDPGYTNWISYPLVEMMVWQGLGDLVNKFRVKTLALDPVSTLWAPGATYRLHVPFTYLWSPGLVPKPDDWADEVDISGFVFLDLASSFQPPKDLEGFLAAGPPPIYIGFGSIVVDDPERFTNMIFEAVKLAGVRALVSKGWGKLGGEKVPGNIYMLENTPHDWLFPRVDACVIHGGAGTTAIALKCGKPTMIVPFFGDQHFWGSMIGNAGAGPDPVPYKHLTAEKLAQGIRRCLTNDAKHEAQRIARDIEAEGDGAVNAVKSFHRHLNSRGIASMRCSILKDQIAVWKPKNSQTRLSTLAANILVDKGILSWKRLRLLRHAEWNDFEGPGEPVTGVAESVATSIRNIFSGIGGVPYRMAKASQKRREKKARKLKAKAEHSAKIAATRKPRIGSAPTPAHPETPADMLTTGTTPAGAVMEEYFDHVTTGVGKSVSALARAPVNLALAVAQGFHNAPQLYGDDTVRRPPRVTGMKSGLRAARLEFVYGIYDGWTGVVRLPYRGAKRDGAKGFGKGVCMGITGFVLKDLAAVIGPFAYTLKGVAKQAGRSRQPNRCVRRARISQGQRMQQALGLLDEKGERKRAVEEEVVGGWNVFAQLAEAMDVETKNQGIAGQISSLFGAGLSDTLLDVDKARAALEAMIKAERQTDSTT